MTSIPTEPLRDARAPRILCYSPCNFWALHGLWEMTVLHGLRLRGAETKYVACDGLYSDCDVFWKSTHPRHARSCSECQSQVSRLIFDLWMEFEWISRYVSPDELRVARCWADSVETARLAQARFRDWEIGEWVKSSVHSHFRVSTFDFADLEIEQGYRSYLYSGLLACFALDRLLRDYEPDVLFLFSGRMSSTRVALELALRKRIRVVCHERGLLWESLKLFENEHSLSLRPFGQIWGDWGEVALRTEELKQIRDHMENRSRGRDIGETAFSPPPEDLDALRARLGLYADRPMWLLFTSSEDEVIANAERKGPFPSQIEWIRHTMEFVRGHPEIDFVIRVHPNTGGERSIGKNLGQLRELEKLRPTLASNMRMVMADDPVSSYSLMDLASLGFAYISITALEMACKGKHVVVGAGAWVRNLPFVHTVIAMDRYSSQLDTMLGLPVLERSREIQQLAYRFAHALYFRWNIPFPLVEMPNVQTGQPRFTSLAQLQPGCDAGLDRVCRVVLGDEGVCPPPGLVERIRSDADEFRFLDQVHESLC